MVPGMDTRRLPYLVEFERLGSMRATAEAMATSTSVVSQQIAALAREVDVPLVESAGRGARLTPEGRRLVEHARTILGAVDTARRDLDTSAEPRGLVRVAGFVEAIRRRVIPAIAGLAQSHPHVTMTIHEAEPAEAHAMLVADHTDIALTYDYDLAPTVVNPDLNASSLWEAPWGLAVPSSDAPARAGALDSLAVVSAFRDRAWIGNSRNTADERALRTLAGEAGFPLRVSHEADSLDLVEDLILAGLGVGLLPHDRPTKPGITVVPLSNPRVRLRACAVVRRRRAPWPPLAAVLRHITGPPSED